MAIRNAFAAFIVGICLSVSAFNVAYAGDTDKDYQWQLTRLISPTKSQLGYEMLGQVYIYNGMKSADIDQAMDMEFDRIQYMMFINTIRTNDKGKPQIDPSTGTVVADSDC